MGVIISTPRISKEVKLRWLNVEYNLMGTGESNIPTPGNSTLVILSLIKFDHRRRTPNSLDLTSYFFTYFVILYTQLFLLKTFKDLNGLLCADVPLRTAHSL